MYSTTSLALALAVYVGAAVYVYRGAYFAWRDRRFATSARATCSPEEAVEHTWLRLFGIVALVVLGGVMVLAGTGLVIASGNLTHGLPISGHEFVQLMKDVIPGLISVVLGFLLLEASNRTFGGKGLRHG